MFWRAFTLNERNLYAINELKQLYAFDHRTHNLLFIADLGAPYTDMLLSDDGNLLVLGNGVEKAVFDLRSRKLTNRITSQKLNIKTLSYSNASGKLSYSSDLFSGVLSFSEDGYSNVLMPRDQVQTGIDNLSISLKKKHVIIKSEGLQNRTYKIKIIHHKDLIPGKTTLNITKSPDGGFYLLNLKSGLYDQLFFISNIKDELQIRNIDPTDYTYHADYSDPYFFTRVSVSGAPEILGNNVFRWKNEPFFVMNGTVYRARMIKKKPLNELVNAFDDSLKSKIRSFIPNSHVAYRNINEEWAISRIVDEIGLIDLRDSVFFRIPDLNASEILDLSYNRARKSMFFLMNDGLIRVYDLKQQKLKGTILIDAAGGVIFRKNDGNIFSSSKEIRSITVNKNGIGDLHDYISFFNDPDVLKEFGLFSESFYQLHSQAKKRLGHRNADSLAIMIQEPPRVLVNQNSNDISLTISSAFPTKIVINGLEEIRLGPAQGNSISLTPNSGMNKVKVYADTAGIPGIPYTFYVNGSSPVKSPKVHFAGFGVDNYQSTAFSPLRYAVKDVSDMSRLFEHKGISYTFANRQVLKDSFMALRSKLKQASVDDIVIIHLSGHGILDRQGKFYFCTYDMDTANPAKNGITVDDINAVFGDCRSRKRLVIIDACHSGFIDRSLFSTDTSSPDSVVLAQKGASSEKLNTSHIDKDPAFQAFKLMLEAYPTFELYTGINMMAAAAGYEYALEMPEWQNGALTYAIKEALLKKAADMNGDKIISIEELKDYIVKRVPVLTKGSQSPDFRLENLEYNWVLW